MFCPFLAYVLSFIFTGIYWNNHHHLIKTVSRVTGPMMWANLALLLCLSFIPYFTEWLARDFAPVPVATYGIDLLACAATFFWLQLIILRNEGTNSRFAAALGSVGKRECHSACTSRVFLFRFSGPTSPWASTPLLP
jgi:uncharacterized membrane protein